MYSVYLFTVLLTSVIANENVNFKTVNLDYGIVKGEKYWNDDFYEFYGVPYAAVPSGRDRFKAPLPPKPWDGVLEAKNKDISCPQQYYTREDEDDVILIGQEDCLALNLFVPLVASEKNLVPVLVYVHSGAFSIGKGNMARFNYLARHDVLVISLNYRLGAVGFACFGTEDIPGNAGLKDQVAALRWINTNIKKFGGDPNRVTVAGFSVGAAMAELLALSKSTDGLIDKLILESGSALAAWAINRDPIDTAWNHALTLGYNKTKDIKDLTEFYMDASTDLLSMKSLHFFLKNGTFGFAPCIENVHGKSEVFLDESPFDILNSGKHKKNAVLTGFANMEGLSRINSFDMWSESMDEDLAQFLPTDLKFKDDKTKENFIRELKEYYFNNDEITHDNIKGYIDYFSDSMFKYPIRKSAELHSSKSEKPVFFYEFSYTGKLNSQHSYMDLINGASHRDQTSYVLDFFTWTGNHDDLDTRDRMTMMWTDFVKYEDPTLYESPLIDVKWHKYSSKVPYYLSINRTLDLKVFHQDGYELWRRAYDENVVEKQPTKVEL